MKHFIHSWLSYTFYSLLLVSAIIALIRIQAPAVFSPYALPLVTTISVLAITIILASHDSTS